MIVIKFTVDSPMKSQVWIWQRMQWSFNLTLMEMQLMLFHWIIKGCDHEIVDGPLKLIWSLYNGRLELNFVWWRAFKCSVKA